MGCFKIFSRPILRWSARFMDYVLWICVASSQLIEIRMPGYRVRGQQQSQPGKKNSKTEIEMAHVTCYDAENGKKTKEEKRDKGRDKLQQQIAEKEAEIAHLKQTINSMEVEKHTYINRLQEAETAVESQKDTMNHLLSSGIEIVSKGQWCNSADLTEPSQLARNIQTIYKKQWISAKRVLLKLVDSNRQDTTNEVVTIKLLSKILQECYVLCEEQAGIPTKRFFSAFSSDKDSTSLMESCSDVERHYLLKIRKKIGMRSAVRSAMEERITKDFWTRNFTPESFIVKFSETEIVSNNNDAQTEKEIETCLEAYISACIKACWGAVLCDPQVRLKFDIVGQNFAEIEEQYDLQIYSLKKPYQNKDRKHDEIMLVVWPPCTTNIPSNGNNSENVIAAENAIVIVNNLM